MQWSFQICISVPLIQNFYFNFFLQKEVAYITYLNIRSFDKVAKDCCNEFSKSVFWAGVEEFLIKQIISFGQQHI